MINSNLRLSIGRLYYNRFKSTQHQMYQKEGKESKRGKGLSSHAFWSRQDAVVKGFELFGLALHKRVVAVVRL